MTITLKLATEPPMEVQATQIKGLAVHRMYGYWAVSHVRSGLGFGYRLRTRKAAVAVAKRLTENLDWAIDEMAFSEDAKKLALKIRAEIYDAGGRYV